MAGNINRTNNLSITQLQTMKAHKVVKKDGALAGRIIAAKMVRDELLTSDTSASKTTKARFGLMKNAAVMKSFVDEIEGVIDEQVLDSTKSTDALKSEYQEMYQQIKDIATKSKKLPEQDRNNLINQLDAVLSEKIASLDIDYDYVEGAEAPPVAPAPPTADAQAETSSITAEIQAEKLPSNVLNVPEVIEAQVHRSASPAASEAAPVADELPATQLDEQALEAPVTDAPAAEAPLADTPEAKPEAQTDDAAPAKEGSEDPKPSTSAAASSLTPATKKPVFSPSSSPTPSASGSDKSAETTGARKVLSHMEVLTKTIDNLTRSKTRELHDVSHASVKKLLAAYNSAVDSGELTGALRAKYRKSLTDIGFKFDVYGKMQAPVGFEPKKPSKYDINRLLTKIGALEVQLKTLAMDAEQQKGKVKSNAQGALDTQMRNVKAEIAGIHKRNTRVVPSMISAIEVKIQEEEAKEVREGQEERSKLAQVKGLRDRKALLESIIQ